MAFFVWLGRHLLFPSLDLCCLIFKGTLRAKAWLEDAINRYEGKHHWWTANRKVDFLFESLAFTLPHPFRRRILQSHRLIQFWGDQHSLDSTVTLLFSHQHTSERYQPRTHHTNNHSRAQRLTSSRPFHRTSQHVFARASSSTPGRLPPAPLSFLPIVVSTILAHNIRAQHSRTTWATYFPSPLRTCWQNTQKIPLFLHQELRTIL